MCIRTEVASGLHGYPRMRSDAFWSQGSQPQGHPWCVCCGSFFKFSKSFHCFALRQNCFSPLTSPDSAVSVSGTRVPGTLYLCILSHSLPFFLHNFVLCLILFLHNAVHEQGPRASGVSGNPDWSFLLAKKFTAAVFPCYL